MRLHTISYSEYEGQPLQWSINDLRLDDRNLIVGLNATGKSRTLNIIAGLSRFLIGGGPLPISASYQVHFKDGDAQIEYSLNIDDSLVLNEKLIRDGKVLLARDQGGEGKIFSQELDRQVRFQAPQDQIAAVVRRDSIQHSFLEPLNEWAQAVRHHQFGTTLGKDHFAVITPGAPVADDRDQTKVLGVFKKALREFGDEFKVSLLADLAKVNYVVDDIGLAAPVSIRIAAPAPEVVGLYVKERDLVGLTDQFSMSQGMYRVLSLLIFANYFVRKTSDSCLLVDDIGEGLDFERSCRLIGVLREKAAASNLQLIMSTNDRYVMNQVPLSEWSILQRKGSQVEVRNKWNSSDAFEEFRFTGMSNFSMLELGFLDQRDDAAHA